MAFHFPLMPRMYMAIAQEDRHPITDIMRQTPEIPESCQWAIFLRNHDELTLEMVTDKERDYLWSFYAADRRARINLGIRRRLAPLLENDRRKIELMNALLLSMPGTPVIYYGDEIGMGDNIYLGDRDGVRTPMQWSPDRNGGFSPRRPGAALPAARSRTRSTASRRSTSRRSSASPATLLNWMRRMIAVRRSHQALRPRHACASSTRATARSWPICASTRARRILCVANLSRAPQAVRARSLRLQGPRAGRADRRRRFPPIGDLPYLLTLPAYGFYWFELASAPRARHASARRRRPSCSRSSSPARSTRC